MRILDFADGFESSVEPTSVSFPASKVSNTPSGNLSALTMQNAVNELQGDIDTLNNKIGAANGIAPLGSDTKIPASYIPAVALVTYRVVADIAARDALVVEEGDVAVVTDAGGGITKTYGMGSSGWIELISDAHLAAHIANTSNPHNVTKSQVGLGNVDNTSDATKNAATATLTNKTMGDALTFTQISTPSNPASGFNKVYPKTDGKLYVLKSDGTETQVGSGSGGEVNLISDGDGSAGTSSYTEGSYGAATRPAGTFTPSSGASAFAISTTTTSPLGNGTSSFLLTKFSGSSRQGRAVERVFDLPLDYRAKSLTLDISYIVNSGTFVAGSPSTDSSLIWYCAFSNDNGSTWTISEPSSFKCLSNSTTISDRFTTNVQSPYDANKMKLIAYVAETANSAWVVKCILGVKPSKYVYGSPVTDSVLYTGSISYGTTVATNITSQTYRQSRSSDKLTVSGNVSFNGPANGNGAFRIPLPPGLSTDTTKITSAFAKVGDAVGYFNSSKQFDGHVRVDGNSTTYVTIHRWDDTGAADQDWGGNTSGASNVPGGVAIANGDGISFTFTVPISGWSSSVQMSDQSNSRPLVAEYAWSGTQSIPNISSTELKPDTKIEDTHGIYDSSTGRFRAPAFGWYELGGFTNMTSLSASTGELILDALIDGSNYKRIARNSIVAGSSGINGSIVLKLNAGQTASIAMYQSNGATRTNESGIGFVYFKQVLGPSQIAASESICARYTNTAGTSYSAGVEADLPFATKDYDSHGSFSGATFTALTSGKYRFSAGVLTASFTLGTNQAITIKLNKNGSFFTRLTAVLGNGVGNTVYAQGSDTVYLLAGETITFRLACDAAVSLNTSAGNNHMTIEKVGN